MKFKPSVSRTFEETVNAQERWDRAFQLILQWASDQQAKACNQSEEKSDEGSLVCQSLNTETTAKPKH